MPEFYQNINRTIAWKLNDHDQTMVEYNRVKLPEVDFVESKIINQSIGEDDKKRIRAANFPCKEEDYLEVVNKCWYQLSSQFPEIISEQIKKS